MGTIHFNAGFHLASMMLAVAAGFVGGQVVEREKAEAVLVRDVTEMRVVGQGCGDAQQRQRVYAAREEDNLPGPKCDIVFELVERDYS